MQTDARIRTKGERKECAVIHMRRELGIRYPMFHPSTKNGLIAVQEFKDIHRKNTIKLKNWERIIDELLSKKNGLETLIASTPPTDTRKRKSYAQEIKIINAELQKVENKFEESNFLNFLLAVMLHDIDDACDNENWKYLIKLAKDLNFKALLGIKFDALSKKLQESLQAGYDAVRGAGKAVSDYEETCKREGMIHKEALGFSGKTTTEDDDIIAQADAKYAAETRNTATDADSNYAKA